MPNAYSRLTRQQVREIKEAFRSGSSRQEISQITGVSYSAVCYHVQQSCHKFKPAALPTSRTINTTPPRDGDKTLFWKEKYIKAASILAENGLL